MTVLVGTDHGLVRNGLREVLDQVEVRQFRILECANFSEAVEAASRSAPIDIAFLDPRMPGMDGVVGIRIFHERYPEIPVVVISSYYERNDIIDCFQNGAVGFVGRTADKGALVGIIYLILAGQIYVPPEIIVDLCTGIRFVSQPRVEFEETNPLDQLSERQKAVLDELVKGYSNKVIARNLGIQEVTVKLHLRYIFKKLGAENRVQAVKIALGQELHD